MRAPAVRAAYRRPVLHAPRTKPAQRRRGRGRPAATPREWAIIRTAVVIRARYRCQACGARRPLEVPRVVKRSQGGSDAIWTGLVALYRRCHAWTDAAYRQGRLVITPQRDGPMSS